MSDRWTIDPYRFGLFNGGGGGAFGGTSGLWPDGQPAVPPSPAYPAGGAAPVPYLVPLYGGDLLDPEPIYDPNGGSVRNVHVLGIDPDPLLVPYIGGPALSPYHSWGAGATWNGGLAASSPPAAPQSALPDVLAAVPSNDPSRSQPQGAGRPAVNGNADDSRMPNGWADLAGIGLTVPSLAAAGTPQAAWPQSPSPPRPDASSFPPMPAMEGVPFLDPTAFAPSGFYDPSRNAEAYQPENRFTQGGRSVGNYEPAGSDLLTGIRQPPSYESWQATAPWDGGFTSTAPHSADGWQSLWPEPPTRTRPRSVVEFPDAPTFEDELQAKLDRLQKEEEQRLYPDAIVSSGSLYPSGYFEPDFEDYAKSAGIGLVKGAIGVAGTPGDIQEQTNRVVDWVAGTAGMPADRIDLAHRLTVAPRFPTSSDVRSEVERYTGPLYEPRTRIGRGFETIGNFAVNAAVAPGAIIPNVIRSVGPAIASEVAGQLTEGTAAEPYARYAGSLFGGKLSGPSASTPVMYAARSKGGGQKNSALPPASDNATHSSSGRSVAHDPVVEPADLATRGYDVAFSMTLKESSIFHTRPAHVNEARSTLLRKMEVDPEFGQRMREEFGVTLWRGPLGGVRGGTPDMQWHHHHSDRGRLELVHSWQHTRGTPYWDIMHPDGRGGYANWGRGSLKKNGLMDFSQLFFRQGDGR